MRSPIIPTRPIRQGCLPILVGLVAMMSGCSGTTEPQETWARISLISGDNQTVTISPIEHLADFPQPVVIRLDSLGIPVSGGDLRVAVRMSDAPGPNGPYAFSTGPDGTAVMQLQISNIPGPVGINVSYVRCARWGFKWCDEEKTLASLSLSAVAVR